MIVVGGGVIGTEYACMHGDAGREGDAASRAGTTSSASSTTRSPRRSSTTCAGWASRCGSGEKVAKIERRSKPRRQSNGPRGPGDARIRQEPARRDAALRGRPAGNDRGALELENVGLVADDRERLKVNAQYQTDVAHIYAVGDVIGFPALASTAMEQGRLAVCHAFGAQPCSIPELFPYGIYAIPEISMVGKTEDQLTEAGIPYEAGIAQYKELARGQLLGDDTGMLKLLIHQETHQILGVHAIGTDATELIHIGQAVMAFNGTVEYFINNVFNFPTLAEATRSRP